MDDRKYQDAIAHAAGTLSSYYYLIGEDLPTWEQVRRGMVMGLAVAFGADPQSVDYDLENYRG